MLVGAGFLDIVQVELAHARLHQPQQLISIHTTIAVRVAPDAQPREHRVVAVDQVVIVAVQLSERDKTIARIARIARNHWRHVSEKFRPAGDRATSVTVEHQQAVIRPDPPGQFGKSVAVMVEMHLGGVAKCRNPIAIEIQNDRAARLLRRKERVFQKRHLVLHVRAKPVKRVKLFEQVCQTVAQLCRQIAKRAQTLTQPILGCRGEVADRLAGMIQGVVGPVPSVFPELNGCIFSGHDQFRQLSLRSRSPCNR